MKKPIKQEVLIPLVISLLINGISIWYNNHTNNKNNAIAQEARLAEGLNKILDVTLQYPYVDDTSFISRWDKNINSESDSAIRYDTYCDYVFNLLQDASKFYSYDKVQIQEFTDVKEWVSEHKGWWHVNSQSSSYPKEFRQFIDSYFLKQ